MWWHARLQEIQATRKKKASARFGRHMDTQVVIFDLTGLPMVPDKAGVKLFLGTTKIDEVRLACIQYLSFRCLLCIAQLYYPETLDKLFMINAGWYSTHSIVISSFCFDLPVLSGCSRRCGPWLSRSLILLSSPRSSFSDPTIARLCLSTLTQTASQLSTVVHASARADVFLMPTLPSPRSVRDTRLELFLSSLTSQLAQMQCSAEQARTRTTTTTTRLRQPLHQRPTWMRSREVRV